jgi:hypothetical protein
VHRLLAGGAWAEGGVEGVKGDRGQPKITIIAPKTDGFVHFMVKNRKTLFFSQK